MKELRHRQAKHLAQGPSWYIEIQRGAMRLQHPSAQPLGYADTVNIQVSNSQ